MIIVLVRFRPKVGTIFILASNLFILLLYFNVSILRLGGDHEISKKKSFCCARCGLARDYLVSNQAFLASVIRND